MPLPSWLHADLNTPLKAPLVSTMLDRDPTRLAFVVSQFHVEAAERFRKRDTDGRPGDETFCNFFAVAVSTAMSVPLPQMRANALAMYLDGQSQDPATGWERIDEHIAQRMADQGQLAVAVWANSAGPGHIAVLVPSLDQGGTWIAQAGASNFTRGLIVRGFGDREPEYFGHP